ncbi:hypothetical protein P3W45_000074 [Vairimorpha bombi]|jgi:ABC-type transport system involved in Fe-S cluster assembly fused permease/ATPase subunit
MSSKKALGQTDFEILKDILIEYVVSKPFVRTFVMYTLIGTFIACFFNVQTGESTRSLTHVIMNNLDIEKSLVYYSVIMIVSITLTELNNFIFTTPVQHVFRLTGKNSFRNFIKMELTKYNKIGCGEIQTIIDRESKAISELIEVIFLNIIPIFFTLILAFTSIYMNLGLVNMGIIVVTIAIYIILTIKIVHWRTTIRYDYNNSQQRCSNHLHDSLINHETILAYKTEEEEALKYDKYVSDVEYECNRLWRSLSVLFLVNKIIFAVQSFLVIIFGNFEILTEKLTAKDVVFYLAINKTLYSSLGNLGFFYSRYTQAILNVRTSFKPDYIIEEENVVDHEYFKDNINAVNLSFMYNKKTILENINFNIAKGEKIAIIGKNGVGKTSLVKMIMKFESYSGRIYLDGLDTKNISNATYRRLISYIPQTSFLFNETVLYNLVYGTNITDEEEVYKLSKDIKVHDSINNLEHQYRTHVGDKGQKLSGGERQKVLLLRSLLKKSPILILDEPTAALDHKSEFEILNHIISENENSTIIMILHNLEMLYMFDKIFHIDNKGLTTITKIDGKFDTIKL